MAKRTTNLDDDKAQPRGDTGDDNTLDEQGISNREGDADNDEFEDDADDLDGEEDEDSESSA